MIVYGFLAQLFLSMTSCGVVVDCLAWGVSAYCMGVGQIAVLAVLAVLLVLGVLGVSCQVPADFLKAFEILFCFLMIRS